MNKRYYKLKETVWVIKDKAKATVKSLDIPNKDVVVLFDDNKEKVLKLWEIDKYKNFNSISADSFTIKSTDGHNKMFYSRLDKDVKEVSKRDEDAGYDIYTHIPEGKSRKLLYLPKGQATMVSTKLAFSVTKDFAISLQHERGSVGTLGTVVTAGLIDSGYRNEVFVSVLPVSKSILITDDVDVVTHVTAKDTERPLTKKLIDTFLNKEDEELILYPYHKAIAQAVIIPVVKTKVIEIPYEELKNIKSERGMGKLGSSNK